MHRVLLACLWLVLLLSACTSTLAARHAAVRPVRSSIPPDVQVKAVQGLISRLLGPSYVAAFQLSMLQLPEDGHDIFTLSSSFLFQNRCLRAGPFFYSPLQLDL